MASLLGGMALANVKLGAVHGFAGPLGGKFPVRHGVVCASLLPAVMEINIGELLKQNKHEKLDRYKEVARILTGNNKADIFDGVDFTKKLVKQLGIPGLSEFGISKTHFKELVEKASASSSMQGNPVKLSEEKLLEILQKSY